MPSGSSVSRSASPACRGRLNFDYPRCHIETRTQRSIGRLGAVALSVLLRRSSLPIQTLRTHGAAGCSHPETNNSQRSRLWRPTPAELMADRRLALSKGPSVKAVVIVLVGVSFFTCLGGSFARERTVADSCDSREADSTDKKGLFTVRQRCGRVLYEIPSPILNRVMLINTEFAAHAAVTGTAHARPLCGQQARRRRHRFPPSAPGAEICLQP